jgi:hypothetical protein
VKLNQAFDPAKGGYVEYPFQISPDSKYVVYKTRISDSLHSVPINGSAPPIKISGPLIPSGFISAHEIQITSDSQTVLYRGEGTSNSNYDLFSTSINGSRPAHKLNGSVPIVAGYPYQFDFGNSVLISPNNQFVTFHGAQGEYSGRSLYVASVDPNVPLPLPPRGQHKMFLPSVARN